MPPLLSSRTCWRAGWAVLGLGVVLMAASNPVARALFQGQGPGALGDFFYSVLSAATFTMLPAGAMLLVGSVVVRHVERLTGALVASGTIEALSASPSEHPGGRTPGGAVDLDDDLDDVVEHEPGVR